MQAFQVDHAGRAYHALTEAVEEVNIRRTRIAPLRIYAAIPQNTGRHSTAWMQCSGSSRSKGACLKASWRD
ncbi:hypothetical protein, partial [Infirmifilum uzonense]|uniref:hypothetical protein n=1 Tax=Infirmifilum uzonense TaxID=1550241 RepID=UPI003C7951D1